MLTLSMSRTLCALGVGLVCHAGLLAQTLHYGCSLDGQQEVPPTGSAATGFGIARLDAATNTLTVSLDTSGVVGTAAHIHQAPAGVNGPVIVPLAGGPAHWTATAVLSAAQVAALQAGNTYFNVHSAAFPGGEIRGQIQAAVRAFGLPNLALGQATLALTPVGLAVGNLGSSGQDGVSVVLGSSGGSCVVFGPVDPTGTLPATASLEAENRGRIGAGPSERLEAVVARNGVSGIQLSLLPGTAYGQFAIEAYLDGQLVGTGSGSGGTFALALQWPYWMERREKKECRPWHTHRLAAPGSAAGGLGDLWIGFGPPDVPGSGVTPVVLGAQPPVNANLLRIVPQGGAVIDSIQHTDLTTADVPALTISGEAVYQFGERYTALTADTIMESNRAGPGGGLSLSSAQAATEYGAQAAFCSMVSLEQVWNPLDPSGTAPVGSYLQGSAIGELGGTPDQQLGSIRFTKAAAGVAIAADFSSLGSPTQRIQVLANGVVVADLSGHTGPVGTASRFPFGLGKLWGRLECYKSCHPPGTTFVISGTSYTGDTLLVLAESNPPVGPKSAFDIRAAGLPEVVLLGGSRLEEYGQGCPGTGGLVPMLSNLGFPTVGNAGFGLQVSSALANAPALLLLGALPASVPLGGGCELSVQPLLTLNGATGPAGTGTFALPIPPVPTFAGGDLYTQSAVIDPNGAFQGIASVTAGLRLLIGS